MPEQNQDASTKSSGKLLSHQLHYLLARARDQPWSDPIVVALVVGGIALLMLTATRDRWWASIAPALLIAAAAFAGGALLGFLFGIPRAVQETRASPRVLGNFEVPYQVNTNLEHISDWLTKIIVGLGLVQLQTLPGLILRTGNYAATAFEPAIPPSLSAVILAYFSVCGFFACYLWTRLFLTLEFTRADRAARNSPEFYEGLIEALLYQPAPAGFQEAIAIGEEYNKQFGEGNWRVWRSLACAYGQQYQYLSLAEPKDNEQLSLVRKQALRAVGRILHLNQSEREGIVALWDPKKATPQEDDLVVFYDDDAEFAKLLRPQAA